MQLDIKALARLGAHARLAELESERLAIYAEFPDLAPDTPAVVRPRPNGAVHRSVKRGLTQAIAHANGTSKAARTHWASTPAGRKAISKRLKAYWAQRRAAGAVR